MKFNKFIWKILFVGVILSIFTGCDNKEEEPLKTQNISENPPSDVPIAKNDENITIDVQNPPVPPSE